MKTVKTRKIQAKYDVTESKSGKHRRKAQIETQSEEGILRPYDRLKAINLCRDLERNSSVAKGFIRQLKVNIVGALGGKMQINTSEPETNKAVSSWFNGYWAKNCDGRDDNHFNDFLKLIIGAVEREGDCLVVFDNFLDNDGKLLFFEADQLVTINDADWKKQTTWGTREKDATGKTVFVPYKQESGVIFDKRGKVKAYAVTAEHGQSVVTWEKATIVPKEAAKLLKNPWRFNQLRGISDMITASADLQDIYEMKGKELQSAKAAASIAFAITKNKPLQEALLRAGINPDDILNGMSSSSVPSTQEKNYESFEELSGGFTEYLAEGEDIKVLDHNRPNVAAKNFFEFVTGISGAAFGLAPAYSQLRVNSSYTGFRGEMLLSWSTFKDLQKWLERRFCDWVAVKVLSWASSKKLIPVMEAGWEYKISWSWPDMPQVDPEKENNAKNNAVKNSYTDYSQLLGPDWREKMEKAAECLEHAKSLGLPLAAFETVAGAAATTSTNDNGDKTNENLV